MLVIYDSLQNTVHTRCDFRAHIGKTVKTQSFHNHAEIIGKGRHNADTERRISSPGMGMVRDTIPDIKVCSRDD